MDTIYTTGTWKPRGGAENAFVESWREFAEWASSMPGVAVLRLTRDLKSPGRFVSFAAWENVETVRAWKSSPEFSERLGRVRAHVDHFDPTELEVVVEIEGSAAGSRTVPAHA